MRVSNYTQVELGNILKVGPKQIQRYENGDLWPDHDSVQKLCELFKYDFVSLIYDVTRGGHEEQSPYRLKYERLMEDHLDCLKKLNLIQSARASNEQEDLNEEENEMLDIFSSLDSKGRKALSEFLTALKVKQKGISAKKRK